MSRMERTGRSSRLEHKTGPGKWWDWSRAKAETQGPCNHLRKLAFPKADGNMLKDFYEYYCFLIVDDWYFWSLLVRFGIVYISSTILKVYLGEATSSLSFYPQHWRLAPQLSSGSAELLAVSTFTILYKTSHYQAPKIFLSLKK